MTKYIKCWKNKEDRENNNRMYTAKTITRTSPRRNNVKKKQRRTRKIITDKAASSSVLFLNNDPSLLHCVPIFCSSCPFSLQLISRSCQLMSGPSLSVHNCASLAFLYSLYLTYQFLFNKLFFSLHIPSSSLSSLSVFSWSFLLTTYSLFLLRLLLVPLPTVILGWLGYSSLGYVG